MRILARFALEEAPQTDYHELSGMLRAGINSQSMPSEPLAVSLILSYTEFARKVGYGIRDVC